MRANVAGRILTHAVKSRSHTIQGGNQPLWRWLGPAAALALSAASLLVPATALAANETAWSWTQQPSNAAANVAMATNPQLTATGGANLNATIVVTVKVTTTAPAAVPSGTTLSIVAAATASSGWSTSGLSCSADTCTFNAIGTATSAAGPVFTLVDTKVNIASATGYQLAVSSTNVSGATQSNNFTIGGGNKLGFATAAQTSVGVNSNSSVVIVQLQDSSGTAIAAPSDVAVSLTSTSTVTFMNTSFTTIGSAGSASVTITTGASSQSFYFRDSVAESPTITATATGYTTGTQTETVTGTVYASSLTVSGTPNPSAPNQAVTITATATTSSSQQCFNGVSYYPCATYATGYMWFQDSALPQSAICLPSPVTSSGTNIITGTCTYNFATTGAHTITTFYCSTYPTSQFSGFYVYYTCTSGSQTSGTYTQNVNDQLSSTTTLTASPNPATEGQSITFTAVVNGTGGTPTGSLSVMESGVTSSALTARQNRLGAANTPRAGLGATSVAPYRLVFTTEPGNGFGGAALQTQPAVTLLDYAGNVVTGANGNVIFFLNDFGGQSLPATAVILAQAGTACSNNACSVALVGGVASPALFIDTELNVDQSRGYSIYSLSAAADPTLVTSAGVVQGAISSQFQLMTGPPSKIANKSAPVGAAKTQNFQGPTIELDDAGGNPQFQDKTSTNSIQVLDATSQSAPTNGAVLVGTTQLTLSAPAGSTTFRNLSITQNGDYLLRVTSSAGVPTVDIGTGMTAITDPGFATMLATNSGNPVASTDTTTAGKDYIKALKNKSGPKQPFMIRDNQLIVTAPSTAGVIGQPLPPITVSLTDFSGVIQNTNAPVLLRISVSSVDARPAFPGVVAPAYQNATGPKTVGGLGCNTDFLTVGCPILQGNLVAGTVTFSGLTIPAASGAGRYTFTAEMGKDNTTPYLQGMVTCTTYVGVTSTNTNTASSGCTGQLGNVAPGKASGILTLDKQLIFTSQPVGADAGKALTTNPVIVLADGFGTVTSDSYHSGTISLGDSSGKAVSTARLTGSGCATDGASCTVPFSSGAGVFNAISIDTPGTYTLVGSTNAWANNGYAPATAMSATFTVASAVTGLTVSGSPNPSAPNQLVTITGNYTAPSAQCFNGITYYPCQQTGYMWFQDSTILQSPICPPAVVTSGATNTSTGTCTFTFTSAGQYSITAYYCPTFPTTTTSGSYTYYTCASGGASGTYTQNVGSRGTATATICTVTLSGGSGTCSATLSAGTHTLTAVYSGDGSFAASTSSALTVTVSVYAPPGPGGGGYTSGGGGYTPPQQPAPAESPAPAEQPATVAPAPAPPAPPPPAEPPAAQSALPDLPPGVADQLNATLQSLGAAPDADPSTVLQALLDSAPQEVLDALSGLSPEEQLALVQQLLNPPSPAVQSLPDSSTAPDAASAAPQTTPADNPSG